MEDIGHYGMHHDRLVKIIEDSTGEIFIFRHDDFRFVFMNRGAQENLGYSAKELLDMSPLDIKPLFTEETFRALVEPVVSGAVGHIDFETLHRRKDGTTYGCAIRLQLITGEEPLFYASVLDISDRMVAENELRETSQRLNAILANTTMAVFLMDERQHCVFMNRAAEQLTGYTLAETVGRPLHDVVHHTHPDGTAFPIEDCAIDRALPERMQMQGREVFVHKDGHFYNVGFTASPILDASGRPVGTVIEARDIAEELRAEARAKAFNEELAEQVSLAVAEREALTRQLIQSQKMEAIGNLTGGIAHDFNNLLQVVSGNLDLLARMVRGDERATARVEAARAGVVRGGRLASQLLSFARRQPLQPLVLNAGRLIRGMNEMLRSTLGEAVELECVIAGGLWATAIDATQLESALLNLAINARDAMDGQGKLTIEAGNAHLDDSYCREHVEVLPGQYVVIAVTDTGPGMTLEVQEKAFEPFFTTKPEGQGTGLGLSMVYGFVKQSGGHIKIYTEQGEGTTIRIYLPRSGEQEAALPTRSDKPPVGGTETILVVDDDEEVAATAVAMLTDLGYSVVKARSADAALTVLESGIHIDLLFTDVVMPGKLRSPELARLARERLPGIKVLFTSGYTQNAIVHGGKLDRDVELLSKPYSSDALAWKVRSMLGEAASPVPNTPVKLRILVVEDDALILMSTVDMLMDMGHEVEQAMNLAQARVVVASNSIDLVLVDVGLPDGNGLDFAHQLREQQPKLRILVASGHRVEASENLGGIQKPYMEADLASAIGFLFGK